MGTKTGETLDPESVRVERDRRLALLYVDKGRSKTAVQEIVSTTGVNQRTVYRAIKRQLAWALAQQPGSTETTSPDQLAA